MIYHGKAIRAVDREYNIDHMALTRFISQARNGDDSEKSNYASRKEFEEHEKTLFNGLFPKSFMTSKNAARHLAHQFGSKNKIQMSPSWEKNEKAGWDWADEFMKRQFLQYRFAFNKEQVCPEQKALIMLT